MFVSLVHPENPLEAQRWQANVPSYRPDMSLQAVHAASQGGLLDGLRLVVISSQEQAEPVALGIIQHAEVRGPGLEDPQQRHPLQEHIVRLVVIAPAIPSGLSGIVFRTTDPSLRREAVRALLRHLVANAPSDRLQAIWDIQYPKYQYWIDAARELDFFPVPQGYSYLLELPSEPAWRSFDDYFESLRSRYRKHHRRWMLRAEVMDLSVTTVCGQDLVERIATAAPLIQEVTTRQGVFLELPTSEYLQQFAALAGAEMTVCQHAATQHLLGVNLLLHGGDELFNLYVGFHQQDRVTYQALLRHSVHRAIELNCRRLRLGQRAEDSKLKLGAMPTQTMLFARHPISTVHQQLRELDSSTGLPHEPIAALVRRRRVFHRSLRQKLHQQRDPKTSLP